MAHITSIKIEGLLGRKEPFQFDLQRDVNIFFGENGCGKTTLLKILHLALTRDGEAMRRLPVDRAEVHVFSVLENKVIRHTWERKKEDAQSTLPLQEGVQSVELVASEDGPTWHRMRNPNEWKMHPLPRRAGSKGGRWAHTFLPTTRLYVGGGHPVHEGSTYRTPSGQMTQLSDKDLDQAFAESVKRAWLVYSSRVLLEVRSIQEEGLREVLRNVLTSTPRSRVDASEGMTEKYERVARFLTRQPTPDSLSLGTLSSFMKRYGKDANLRKVVDNLDYVERRIEDAMVPLERFQSTLHSLLSSGKKVSTSGNELRITLADGQVISAASLSSGEKHLLKILLSAMTSAENTVIIDEPELSMHIDWQRAFVRTVRALNPACQLILATHSPEIMADVEDGKIFRV